MEIIMKRSQKLAVYVITAFFFLLYILTDTIELFQSGLSSSQMILTYIAMAGISLCLIGIYAADEYNKEFMRLIGIILISVSFVYFSGTATYAFAEKSPDYAPLVRKLGSIYLIHGVMLIMGTFLFAVTLLKEKSAYYVVSIMLIVSSLLSFSAGLFGFTEQLYVVSNFIRNSSFVIYCLLKAKNNKAG
jgi:hypothetical protein